VKYKLSVFFMMFMVGCTPNSGTSSLNISSSAISIPQPDVFDKNRDGKTVLIEQVKSIEFSRENNNFGNIVRLIPENYRETEDVWVLASLTGALNFIEVTRVEACFSRAAILLLKANADDS